MDSGTAPRRGAGDRLCVVLTALAVFVGGCAAVHETRTRELVSDESLRLAERPRPELDVIELEPEVFRGELLLSLDRVERCVVDFAERRTTREHLVRAPDKSVLAAEVVVLGTGLGVAVWGLERDRGSGSDGAISGGALEAMSVIAILASGTALMVDASKAEDRTSVTTTLSGVQDQRVVKCSRQSRRRLSRVELRTSTGRRFMANVDALGHARVRIADDAWVDGRIDADLFVDGRVVRRLNLRRPP